jgi:membrane protease subunit HflK
MMNRHDQQTFKRGVSAALLGFGVQLVVAFGLLALAGWTGTAALVAATWHAFGGVAVWLCLVIVYQQQKLAAIEALEAEQLAQRHGTDSSLFQTTADDLAVAQRRLKWLYRWVVPLTAVFTAAYLIFLGVLLTRSAAVALAGKAPSLPLQPGVVLSFCIGIGFVAFLISRYIAGMAKQTQWQMLRAGAGYLMGSVLFLVGLVVGMGFAYSENDAPLRYVALAIPVLMIVIGIEIVLNFVFDVYRPRKLGENPRTAFDSRLLSFLTAPESIAKTINEAVNYQFGFEITRSWFWQLLSKAFGYLVVFGAGVMLLFSCIVIVEPYQQVIVTRFGKLTGDPLRQGIHFKLPWPVSVARNYDVTTVRSLPIGSIEDHKPGDPILWATPHSTTKPENLIVAAARVVQKSSNPAAPPTGPADQPLFVSVVNAEITLFYRVDEDHLLDYVRASVDSDDPNDPDGLDRLRLTAIGAVSRYLFHADEDAWIGEKRRTAGGDLQKLIQAAADEQKLGVTVLDVAISSVHPPQEVADAFHEVVAAQLEKQTKIQSAKLEATKRLATTAGSAGLAQRIEQQRAALVAMEKEKGLKAPDVEVESQKLEQLLLHAGGDAAVVIAQARGYRWEKENSERGNAERFAQQAAGYRLSPEFYRSRAFLQVMADGMARARKYVLIGDHAKLIFRGDFKDVSGGIEDTLQTIQDKK